MTDETPQTRAQDLGATVSACGHTHCPADECTALDEFRSIDYTRPGFTHPDQET